MIVEASSENPEYYRRAASRFRGADGDLEFLSAPETLALLSIDGDDVVGWCWGHYLLRPDGASMMYLHELEVAKTHRDGGRGHELLTAFMDAARRRGASRLFLTTGSDNLPARRLYERLGGELATQGPTVNYWFALDSDT